MPNPSVVYEQEFDPVFQAGGGPKEVDDDGSDEAVAGSVGVLGGASGLADGLPGGGADDAATFCLDPATVKVDNINYAAHLDHIAKLEAECQQLEAVWARAKADSKAAFADFDAAQARLRSYIRGLAIPMPLFEGESNASPAGESDELGGVEDDQGGTQDARGGPPGECGLDRGDAILRAAKDALSTPKCPSPVEDNEEWESAELAGILPSGIAKKLAAAKLRTVGELAAYLSDNDYSDIKGIGSANQQVIEDCLENFWRQRQEAS